MRNCELEISLLVTVDERRDEVMIKELNEESLRDFCRFPLRQREPLTRGNRLPMKMTTDAQQPRAMCNQNREKCVWWNDWIWNGMENNNFFMCSILIAILSLMGVIGCVISFLDHFYSIFHDERPIDGDQVSWMIESILGFIWPPLMTSSTRYRAWGGVELM